MKLKLFDYIAGNSFIHRLSGVTKLLCFLLLTCSTMFSYDVRFILVVMAFSFACFKISGIKFSQIRMMFIYVVIFLLMNFVLTYLFSPEEGVAIYGTRHEIARFSSRYTVTQEQLLYQCTKVLKYASVVPFGMLFILTTNPSEFASSLNGIGVNYKASYAVALTLRYFPDMGRSYTDISMAQQSRGLDMSKKEKLSRRIRNMMAICVPLIFSTLDRIDVISNAMDLRGFGKHKKRTWYSKRKMKKSDWVALAVGAAFLAVSLSLTTFVNGSRFWNPFI